MKISIQRLLREHAILLPNIQTGLETFPHVILQKTALEYMDILKQMIRLNGEGRSYADFYWGRLDQAEQNRLLASFPPGKKDLWGSLISSLDIGCDDLYFPLEDMEFMRMLHFLSTEEILFSSFYFTKFPCTLWGNYSLCWPALFSSPEIKAACQDIITPVKT